MKPGGKIIVTDAFLKKNPQTTEEKRIVTAFYEGMLLPNLYLQKQFLNALIKTGFKNIRFYDKSQEVIPSSRQIYKDAKLFYPYIRILSFLHLIPKLLRINCIAGIIQYEGLFNLKLATYGTFYAEKPLFKDN